MSAILDVPDDSGKVLSKQQLLVFSDQTTQKLLDARLGKTKNGLNHKRWRMR